MDHGLYALNVYFTSGIPLAVVLGESEIAKGVVKVTKQRPAPDRFHGCVLSIF